MNSFVEVKTNIDLVEDTTAQGEISSDKLIMAMANINQKIDTFKAAITKLLDNGDHLVLLLSGKDSSVVMLIALHVIADYKKRGGTVPKFAVIHGDTGVENPEVEKLIRLELDKISDFLITHNLGEGSIHIAKPAITSDYLVSLISGRAIGIMPDNGSASCSIDLKVQPMNVLKNKLFKDLKSDGGRVTTLLGSRHSESILRSKSMLNRQESNVEPVQNKNGEWILSPIADFSIEDVFLIFDYAKRGVFNSYSDLQAILNLYGSATEPGSCSLLAFKDADSKDEGCGGGEGTARFGCFMCLRVKKDSSLINLSLGNSKYSYLSKLNEFRNFIQDTHYDPSKRNWISRTVDKEGKVTLAPNSYSAEHCQQMLRIAVSIDVREEREADALGIEPRFTLITQERLVAIEIGWFKYGFHVRFEAMRIYNDVRKKGNEVDIPVIDKPYTRLPPFKSVKLPFCDSEYNATFNGFRDVMSASADVDTTTSRGKKIDSIIESKYGSTSGYLEYLSQRQFGGGDTYANYLRRSRGLKEREANKKEDTIYEATHTANRLSFDEEGMELFFSFPEIGIDYYVDKYGDDAADFAPASGIYELLRLGFVSVKSGIAGDMDRMIRMANQINRLGIRNILNNPEALIAALSCNAKEESNSVCEVTKNVGLLTDSLCYGVVEKDIGVIVRKAIHHQISLSLE